MKALVGLLDADIHRQGLTISQKEKKEGKRESA
jgi:hypothetical protein